jgi:hypothetical protein
MDWELVISNLDICIDAVSKIGFEGGPHLRASSIRERFIEIIKDEAIATSLARQTISLASYRKQVDSDISGCVSNISSSLSALISDQNRDSFESLVKISLECDSIVVAAKALVLSFSADAVLRDASILTDIRPIFNDEGPTDIYGAVIIQTLMLRTISDSSAKTFSVSMDKRDIDDLIEKLQRAKLKADLSIKTLEQKNIEGFIAGEETYGF